MTLENTVPNAFRRNDVENGTPVGNIPAEEISAFGLPISKSKQISVSNSSMVEDKPFSWLNPSRVDVSATSALALDASADVELSSAKATSTKTTMTKQLKSEVTKQQLLKNHGVDPDYRWVGEDVAAALTGLSLAKLRSDRFNRNPDGLPYTKIGKSVRYNLGKIKAFMEERQIDN